MLIFILFYCLNSGANDLDGEIIYSNVSEKIEKLEKKALLTNSKKVSEKKKRKPSRVVTNLPVHYKLKNKKNSDKVELLVLNSNKVNEQLHLPIATGESLIAAINHSIIAFIDEKTPVVAEVLRGKYRKSVLLGEASLEPNTKRVLIRFKAFRYKGSKKTVAIKAIGLNENKQPGFIGVHHSQEAKYFTGDFISSMVAGYFDSLVPRQSNVLGQQIEDNSVDSAFKKGLAAGAMSSSKRFQEKLKNVPEFVQINEPNIIYVLGL